MWVQHEQGLVMALRPGWVEVGQRRSEMKKINYKAGEIGVWGPRHIKVWLGAHVEHLLLTISDPALRAANDGISGNVEMRCVQKLADPRLGALMAAVNGERVAGFPSGRLFLDSIEQALAVALVNDYAVRRPSPRIYRGGLTPARLRKVMELVHAEMDNDLSLEELADAAGVSITHFSRMFRESTGQSPHQFVLHRKVDRAKELLRAAEMRVLDVAVACGFKNQQHFARVFRRVCGASPTEYRQEFAHRDQPDRWQPGFAD
jgi:AraC family transcriptional regulator